MAKRAKKTDEVKADKAANEISGETDKIEDAVIIEESDAPEGEPTIAAADDPSALPPEPGDDSTSDTNEDTHPEPTPAPDPAPAAPRRGPGFFALVFGGLLAGAIGFGAAQFLGNDAWPFRSGPSATDLLAETVQQQSGDMAAIQSTIDDLGARLDGLATTDALADLSAQQERIAAQTGQIEKSIQALDQRLSDLENRPIPDVGATQEAVAAYERQLAAMRQMFESELARIDAAQQEALAAETTAVKKAGRANERAAVAGIQAALETGAGFDQEMLTLRAAAIDVPEALSSLSDTGAPTLASLQESFPSAARAALDAATREQAANGEISRFTAFLQTQLGTRSLEPREGDDPDAVLSRAEAALRQGNVQQVLDLLGTLPDVAQDAISGWTEMASVRLAAENAVSALVETLNE